MKIILTGGTGFIGSALRLFLAEAGHSVNILSRKPLTTEGNWISWDPEREIIDRTSLEGHDAVIHLAGENIASYRWTSHWKASLRRSRIVATAFLSRVLAGLSAPPRIFLGASAVGYYGFESREEVDESSPPGRGFLAELCREWEMAAEPVDKFAARRAHLRFGIVLNPSGGMLKKILPLFRWGLGGVLGGGNQYLSWVSLEDLVRAVGHVLTSPLSGAVNITSPVPTTNREFTKTLGRFLGRPTILPVPAIGLKMVFGQLAEELLLGGQRAVPSKLLRSGFVFRLPSLEMALNNRG